MFMSASFLPSQPAMALFRFPPAPGSAGSVNLRREQLAWWVTLSVFIRDERVNLWLNGFTVQTDHHDEAHGTTCANLLMCLDTGLLCILPQFVTMSNDINKSEDSAQADTKFCDWHYYLCFACLKYFCRKSTISLRPLASARFRSVYYAAPIIIPYQMDLIQIVKVLD